MGYAAGYAAGANAETSKQTLELNDKQLQFRREEAAQIAKLKRQELAQARDATKQTLEFRREEAAQTAKLKRQELAQARDAANFEMYKQGFGYDENGNIVVRSGSAADLQQKEIGQLFRLLQLQSEELKAFKANQAQRISDEALVSLSKNGDARELQRALDINPYLKRLWESKGVKIIDNINFESDKQLLANAGIGYDQMRDAEYIQNVKRNYFKYYNGESWQVASLSDLVSQTGVLNRVDIESNEHIKSALYSLSPDKLSEQSEFSGSSNFENVSQETEFLRNQISDYVNATSGNFGSEKSKTTAVQRNFELAEEKRKQIDELMASEDFDTNSEKQEQVKIWAHEVLKLSDNTLSSREEKQLTELSEMLHRVKGASELTPEDTGLVDIFGINLSKYTNENNISNKQAMGDYAALANVIRHSLFGGALTNLEAEEFQKQMSSLNEKYGPVLSSLMNVIESIQNDFVHTGLMNDPVIAKVFLRSYTKEIEDVKTSISDALKVYDKVKNGTPEDSDSDSQVGYPSLTDGADTPKEVSDEEANTLIGNEF